MEHRTNYKFDRPIKIYPHVIRLRPAPHSRTPIEAYSLTISPADHFVNWQQDPFGNYLARVVFPNKASELDITVGLVADMGVINPFDFFMEEYAETFPFTYPDELAADLQPYLDSPSFALGPVLDQWLAQLPVDTSQSVPTITFLSALNSAVNADIAYSVRMEEGVQTPDETLSRRIGSCRDSAWLLVTALRHFGLAARFVSGYLVQLSSDQKSLDGPSGPEEDFTDLHAWAEVYIPGAGWVGLDPTSALYAGEGHIPLAATPQPSSSAAISGAIEPSQTVMEFSNTVERVHEDPRVTKPYSAAQVAHLQTVGEAVDERLDAAGLQLTMGGEPTFVSVDDMTSAQWTIAADGPEKRVAANELAAALGAHFGTGGLVQRSQGKWYPGETLPRWQIGLIWRTDGEPLWHDPTLHADPFDEAQADDDAAGRAERLARAITAEFGLPPSQLQACYEDPLAVLAAEVRQPEGPRPGTDPSVSDLALVTELDQTEPAPVAWALPLIPSWFGEGWASAAWRTRRGRLVLVPGDSPAGMRLPLSSVSWVDPDFTGEESYAKAGPQLNEDMPHARAVVVDPDEAPARTALAIEARDGYVHLFLPPVEKLEKFVELIRLIERVAAETETKIILEGYGPPPDARIKTLMVTPDPGVIEVNVHPTSSWRELSDLTHTLYQIAREHRLGTETFANDGRHSGTGGGNHITLGGAEPAQSPMLRRPDILVSLLTFWQHHPSLSYLFSGRFIGPTSQAPRFDEGRPENLYEMEISFAEIEDLDDTEHRPWAVDRALRHLLTDITGNTHRAEFCIDKLYSPDSMRGRLGLLELRGFEMPPHPDMALVQALLVRSLVARFAETPFSAPLVRWGTQLHERFLLPHFAMEDIGEVVADLRAHGIDFDLAWLAPYLEFRFPRVGITEAGGVELELRSAIEPWHVLGEESSSGGTARYVDSSTEKLQVKVDGFVPGRHLLTCNGAVVPLSATSTPGSFVAGVRFKAWKPWSSLHPTLDIDSPLTFDVVDVNSAVSLGGAVYHVVHPGGRSYDHPPVNAKEAEARRARRFEAMGHTTGVIDVDALNAQLVRREASGSEYPLTLDLRRRLPRRWGRG
ncbi:MAG TPA: transglutaminase family protein [Propionibacteriaceae bacterium]